MSYNIDTINEFGNLPFVTDDTLADQAARFVQVGADGVVTVAGAGEVADGVLRNNPVTGEAPAIGMDGFPYVVAGEALSIGDVVASDANGAAVVAAGGAANMGKVLEAAASGEKARIKLYDGSTTTA